MGFLGSSILLITLPGVQYSLLLLSYFHLRLLPFDYQDLDFRPALAISRWAVVFYPVLSLTALLESQACTLILHRVGRDVGSTGGQGSRS